MSQAGPKTYYNSYFVFKYSQMYGLSPIQHVRLEMLIEKRFHDAGWDYIMKWAQRVRDGEVIANADSITKEIWVEICAETEYLYKY